MSNRKCKECGVSIGHKPQRNKFCSQSCYWNWLRVNGKKGKDHHFWKGGATERECLICGKKFTTDRWKLAQGYGKYCSQSCFGQWLSVNSAGIKRSLGLKEKKKKEIVCEGCGEHFFIDAYRYKRRFCKRECYDKHCKGENHPAWKGGRAKCVCEICGKHFTIAPSLAKKGRGRFCSTKCMGIWQSEYRPIEEAPGWKGGKSFEVYPPEFNRKLKKKIRKRDGHKCAICGRVKKKKQKAFHVHHIDYDKHNNNELNLITLCMQCHRLTNGNRRYWQEMLSRTVLFSIPGWEKD